MLLLLSGVLLFTSCKNSNEAGNFIPADASMVMHINGKSLQEKLPWSEIQQNPWFSKLMSDSSMTTLLKTIMQDPKNSGIDTKSDLMMFTKSDSLGAYVAWVGNIQNMDKFVAFSNELTKTTGKPDNHDDVFILKNNSMLVSWQATKFLMLMDAPPMKPDFGRDSLDTFSSPAEKKSTRNLSDLALSLYDLKDKNKLGSDEKFATMMETEADVHVWLNAEAIYINEMSMQMGPIGMLNMDKLYKGSIIATSINFEDGKILTAMKAYAGKEITDLWRKYGGNKIDMNLLERLPSKNIAAEFSLNFKPQGLIELLKLANMDGFVNLFLNQLGITADDFIKSIEGDVFFAVTDIKTDSSGKMKPNFIFAATINDQASLNKLIGLAKQQGAVIAQEAGGIYFEQNKTLFAIGNNEQAVKDYVNGTNKQQLEIHKKLSSSGISGFVDVQYILNNMAGLKSTDSLNLAIKNSSLKMWDKVVLSGGKFLNDGFVQNLEIDLLDKKTNSLKQLNNYSNELYQINLKYKPAIDSIKNAMRDSVQVNKNKQPGL